MALFGFGSRSKKEEEKVKQESAAADMSAEAESLKKAALAGDASKALELAKLNPGHKDRYFWTHYAADRFDPEGLYQMGYLLENGIWCSKNIEMAFAYYEAAWRYGHEQAAEAMTRIYIASGVTDEIVDGMDYGDIHGLGMEFLEGELRPQSNICAYYYIMKAADAGFVYSKYMLGAMYEKGLGLVMDLNHAMAYYKACEDYDLEDIDERIKGLEIKMNRSGEVYKIAISQLSAYQSNVSGGEHVMAAQTAIIGARSLDQYCIEYLALAYIEGNGLLRNFDEAYYYARLGELLDFEKKKEFYRQLMRLYYHGWGVNIDEGKSVEYLRKLQDALEPTIKGGIKLVNDVHAAEMLAHPEDKRIFMKGINRIKASHGEIDIKLGLEYVLQAHREGDKYASRDMARFATEGLITEVDLGLALECLDSLKGDKMYKNARNGVLVGIYNMHHYGAFEKLNADQVRREATEALEGGMEEYVRLLLDYGVEYCNMTSDEAQSLMTASVSAISEETVPIVHIDENDISGEIDDGPREIIVECPLTESPTISWDKMDELIKLREEKHFIALFNASAENMEETDEPSCTEGNRLNAVALKLAVEGRQYNALLNLIVSIINGYGLPDNPVLARKLYSIVERCGGGEEVDNIRDDVKMLEDYFDGLSHDEICHIACQRYETAKALEASHHEAENWLVYEYYRYAQDLFERAGANFPLTGLYEKYRVDWDAIVAKDWSITESDDPDNDMYLSDEQLRQKNAPEATKLQEREGGELPENLDEYFKDMIGMEPVQSQLEKIYQTVRLQIVRNEILEKRGMEPIKDTKGYNFILLGNPGTGKTTVARIIAQILYDIKVRSSNSFVEVERSRMISDHIGGTEERMRGILESINGGTLFIDEAYSLYKEDTDNDFGQEAIDVLMKDMEDHRDSYSVIMAGYREPMMNMIRNSNSGFSSRFSYTITLPDYSDEALIEMAKVHMAKNGMVPTEGVEKAIVRCIAHDRIDETFGNARYIRELVNRAIENQSVRLGEVDLSNPDALFELTPEDFWSGEMEEKGVNEYLDDLNNMVGLYMVKLEVQSLINQIVVQSEMQRRGLSVANDVGTLHMAFLGNPGTGKTSVARILGKLYNELGVLKRADVFVECSRADLVGSHLGETAPKVKKMVQSALGGILFIDEAYTLFQGPQDSFGREAIDELISLMENNRDNLIVIFAGYTDEMTEFFKVNPGLQSRVPKELVFEDYDLNELYDIAVGMINKKGLVLTEEAGEALRSVLLSSQMQENFGNARGVRNIVEFMTRKQNVRISMLLQEKGYGVTDEEMVEVLACDF